MRICKLCLKEYYKSSYGDFCSENCMTRSKTVTEPFCLCDKYNKWEMTFEGKHCNVYKCKECGAVRKVIKEV